MSDSLRPWQHAPVARLLDILRTGNAVDMSETGTGKTAVSAYVISQLKLPTLVIAPKISLTSWRRMLDLFETSASVVNYEQLTMGKTPYGAFDKPIERGQFLFVCVNCLCKFSSDEKPTRCPATRAGVHCFSKKAIKQKRGRWTWAPQVKFVVADEGQRAGAMKSLNAELIIAARRQNIRTLGLSATLATSPLQFRAWGFSLGLFDNPDSAFYSWARRHGCGRIPNLPGFHWLPGAERKKEIMADIHSKLIPERGVRVRTTDIPDFPQRRITAELYDLEKDYEIEKLYQQMAESLDALSLRASQDVNTESPLTQLIRARQRIELLKIPLFVELAEDEISKGNSVALFVNFTATLDELRKRLRCECFVSGSAEGVSERDNNIARFQRNENRLILLNSAAGGVAISLQDLHGGYPRVALVSPSFSAVQMLQIFGRLPRDGGKSLSVYRVILAANTIETRIHAAFEAKQQNIEALNDADMNPLTSASA